MVEVVRLNLKMPEYCSKCGFKCCGECQLKGACVSPSALCDGFPLVFKGFSSYGVLGKNNWSVLNRCHGLNIKTGSLILSEILLDFTNELNNNKDLLSLSNSGVSLSVIKSSISEVPTYARYLFNS
ncbi:MAG TPA: hypothetical protein VI790_02290 [Candidatus Nanoarchaeia archaeon]|nr:hypothetical protein [Candidatus Nanoarchaeia archaeon]